MGAPRGIKWSAPVLIRRAGTDLVVAIPKAAAEALGAAPGDVLNFTELPDGPVQVWIVKKSTYAGEPRVNLSPLVVDEITLVGSRCGPFPPALERLASGAVPVDDLVEAVHPLEEAAAAFAHAERPGTFKVLLRPS